MIDTINNTKYAEILATALTRKIETEAENQRVLKIIEGLIKKGEDNLSPEEETLLGFTFRTRRGFSRESVSGSRQLF